MYVDFVSVVGGALCIIIAGPFIPYPSTYLDFMSYKSSSNILYNDYEEDLSSGYIYTTYARIHTIEMKPSSNFLYNNYEESFTFRYICPDIYY